MNKLIKKIFSIRFLDMIPFIFFSIFLFICFWEASSLNYLGLLIWAIGLALWSAGLLAIGKYFHGFPEPKGLVTSGIYSKISNPIYLGGILAFTGLSIFTQQAFIIALTVIQIPFQLYRVGIEQKKLKQKYGEKYLKYKKQTWI